MRKYLDTPDGMVEDESGDWVKLAEVQRVLAVFDDLIDKREQGRHITKVCYGLTDAHLDAVKSITAADHIHDLDDDN